MVIFKWCLGLWGLLMTAFFFSCTKEEDVTVIQPQRKWVKRTVVVVAPLSGNSYMKKRLERTAEWFLANFHDAQLNDTLAIDMQLEWHDENEENLSILSRDVASREDILGVIGPFTSEHVEQFAPACQSNRTPLIAPTATSEEIIRRYAVASTGSNVNKKPFLWSLAESDVSFTETVFGTFSDLFRHFDKDLDYKAAFFAPKGIYGNTFYNWAPFFALEDQVELVFNRQFSDNDELCRQMEEYMDYVVNFGNLTSVSSFCAVENMSQMCDVARIIRKWIITKSSFNFLFDTDDPDDPSLDSDWYLFSSAYNHCFATSDLCEEYLNEMGEHEKALVQGFKGMTPYADPTTGFEMSYLNKFSTEPMFAECKFYDALMIMGFAACYDAHFSKSDENASLTARHDAFNNAIVSITMPDENLIGTSAWNVTSMEIYLSELEKGHLLKFRGASGDIGFDKDTYTASTHTVYVQWQIVNGEFININYFGKGNSGRINDSHASWQYLYDETQANEAFNRQTSEGNYIYYPDVEEQFAVLVQGSNGMSNYRHQSGVLSMYQMLKRGGFDDEHIILVMDESLAESDENNDKGAIRSSKEGDNLLEGVVVDYDNAMLTPEDISDILTGKGSERLPVVLPNNPSANVLLYWAGHGRSEAHGGRDEFAWRENPPGEGFTADMMKQTVSTMSEENSFRKLLIIAEACYAENIIKTVEGTIGVLAVSGASGDEQSWAENWNPDLGEFGVWMSDRFTQNVVNLLSSKPSSSYRDLFLYCTQHTMGSHVRIINSAFFDNLYVTGPGEFIIMK